MDQFDKAKERYERKAGIEQVMHLGQKIETLHLPKIKPPKAPAKRTNEIGMTIYLDGQEISLTVAGDIVGSQRNRDGITILLRQALEAKFGRVNMS